MVFNFKGRTLQIYTIGERLTINECAHEYTGKVIDISNNGGLMLKLDNGEIKIFRGEHATIKR